MKMKNGKNKFLKKVIIFITLLCFSIVLGNTVNAVTMNDLAKWIGSITGGMPSIVVKSGLGYMPQSINSAGVAYCGDQGSIVRNGSKDYKTYYPPADGKNIFTWDQLVSRMEEILYNKASSFRAPSGHTDYYSDHYDEYYWIESDLIVSYGDAGATQAALSKEDGWTVIAVIDSPYSIGPYIDNVMDSEMSKINAMLANSVRQNSSIDVTIDSENPLPQWTGDPLYGPYVTVMGTGDNSHYSLSSGPITETDTVNAYIYSGEYHKSREWPRGYDFYDIQRASWEQNDHRGSQHGYNADGSGTNTLTQGAWTYGDQLYREAWQYVKFKQDIAGGYYATINTDETQTFASRDDGARENDEYIIGPISINYPYYFNISYMTDITLDATNGDGASASLSFANGDFKIVTQSSGSGFVENGTSYPLKDETFYIILNASKANYPDKLSINAVFEYTSYCSVTYNILEAQGSTYQYLGTKISDSEVPYYTMGIRKEYTEYKKTEYYAPADSSKNSNGPTGKTDHDSDSVHANIGQCYIKMSENTVATETGQQMITMPYSEVVIVPPGESSPPSIEGSPYAKKEIAEASAEIEIKIDLGGKVWVDGKCGKESNYNGQANDDADTPMSNVRVILHQRKPNGDESVKAETRTDGNGDYKFTGLNALYTYYVEFVYNGQYYQPTTYKKDGVSWDNSSKGVDPLSDRQNFNAKFQEIGSYPENYAGGPVYTREDLEEAGLIDAFGNPTGSSNQYVNDCMLSSYTGYNQNGTFTREYYPVYTKFLVDDAFNGANKASIVVDSSGKSISTYDIISRGDYNNLKVNQGYVLREIADMGLQKDVLHTTLEMNDKLPQVYKYNKNNDSEAFDISIRMSDYYYGTHYTRELYKEDYYKALDTNPDTQLDVDDLLKVYVTYKIRLRNQSEVIGTAVQEFVDYYDDEYTLIGSDNTVESEQKYKPYIGKKDGTPIEGAIGVTTNNTSKYGTSTQKTINGYNTTYIRTEQEIELQPGEDLYIYITLKVNSVNNLLILDDSESDRGKANIVEINGYRTYYTEQSIAPNAGSSKTTQEYKDGDIAGLVDVDSIPGNIKTDKIDKNTNFEDIPASVTQNLDPNDPNYAVLKNEAEARWLRETYGLEDDTDKAPSIKIILYPDDDKYVRSISGNVFEDARTENAELARIGNGMLDGGEPGIEGVKVELIDLKETAENGGKEVVAQILNADTLTWETASTTTNADGYYEFKGYIPSNYYVKFTYGLGTEDETIFYNGQDFKSTNYYTPTSESTGDEYLDNMYTVPFDVNNPDTTDYFYNLAKAEEDNAAGNRYSDVRDLMEDAENVDNIEHEGTRLDVNDYSNNSGNGVTNGLAQTLHDTTPNTYMIAHSGQLNIEIEYDRSDTGTSDTGSDNLGTDNYDKSGYYHLINFDLGLVERPKAQIKMTKQITNVKVTLRNGNVLFDASDKATNVLWIDHIAHGPDTKNTYETDKNYYDTQMMQVPVVRENSSNKGRIQLTMDEELMQGATIQITYAITAANIGEVDYNNNEFYYYGTNTDFDTIVRTTPNTVIDYVGTQVHDADSADDSSSTRNNLDFIQEQNPDWSDIAIEEIMEEDYLNADLREKAELYDTIIKSNALSKDLLPIIADEDSAKEIDNAFESDPLNALDVVNNTQSVAGVQLILSKSYTPDNSSDDLVYNNMVELVESSNTVGRRMAYSVAGNQDPTVEPQEIDADDSQEVTILPPFGQQYVYYILGTVVAVILIGGIIGVIMVVRKRK